MKRENVELDGQAMDKVFRYWVDRLCLSGWHIVWSFYTEAPSMESVDSPQGETVADYKNRTATIKILPMAMWTEKDVPHDMEQVMVHELLHVVFDPVWSSMDNGSIQQDMFHAKIDEIAWFLVDSRRCRKAKMPKSRKGGK